MHIVRLSLICLVAFAFMVGCGMIGKQAEMSESTVEETAMESDMKEGDTAEAMEARRLTHAYCKIIANLSCRLCIHGRLWYDRETGRDV
jgi:hypothetical protein